MAIFKKIMLAGLACSLYLAPIQASFLCKMVANNKTATFLISGLAITSAVLGYKVFQQSAMLGYKDFQQKSVQNDLREALYDKQQIAQELAEAKNKLAIAEESARDSFENGERIAEGLRADAAFIKNCNNETNACFKKERFKTASINFVFKAYDLKSSGQSLIGLAALFKNKKKTNTAISQASINELLNNIVRLKKDINDTEKPWNLKEVDEMGNRLCSRLLSTLKMRDPILELDETFQSLDANEKEIQTIIDTTMLQGPVLKSSHEKLAIESGQQQNDAQLFVRKNEGLPPHQILGVASDAMMPDIIKAYRALSKKFHSDKVKEAEKADNDKAMKIINDARDTMVRAFNN